MCNRAWVPEEAQHNHTRPESLIPWISLCQAQLIFTHEMPLFQLHAGSCICWYVCQ